jgi:uncharacterized lipoprotein YddW (UPF0748 family)
MNVAWWVVRDKLTTRDSIERLVSDATEHAVRDLVAQIRGRGDAYYANGLEPRAESLGDSDLDPLGVLLERARAASLRVHAWVNVFFVWAHPEGRRPRDPKHVVNAHPDWLIDLDPRGGPDFEGIYVDPRHEAVRAHTLAVFRDIVARYPVDGLHFDYVRYPQVTYAPSPDAHRNVTNFVERCADAVQKRGVRVSAAVFPDPAVARDRVLQHWPRWPIDMACPMAYREDTGEVARLLQAARGAWPRMLWAGLMGYAGRPELLREQVGAARDAGCDGVILFRYEPEWRDLLEAFSNAAA